MNRGLFESLFRLLCFILPPVWGGLLFRSGLNIDMLFKTWVITGMLWIIFLFLLNRTYKLQVKIAEHIISWAIVIFLGAMLMPGFYRAKDMGQLYACENNLKHIGTIIDMYSVDNGNSLPSALDIVTKSGYIKSMPVCPVSGKPYIYIREKIIDAKFIDNLKNKISPDKLRILNSLIDKEVSKEQLRELLKSSYLNVEEIELITNNLNENSFILYCSEPDVHIKAYSAEKKAAGLSTVLKKLL